MQVYTDDPKRPIHTFLVVDVERSTPATHTSTIDVLLRDARGGRVRLQLGVSAAEMLCQHLRAALESQSS